MEERTKGEANPKMDVRSIVKGILIIFGVQTVT